MIMEYEIIVTKRGESYRPEHQFKVLVREDMLYKTYRELKLRFPEYKLKVSKDIDREFFFQYIMPCCVLYCCEIDFI